MMRAQWWGGPRDGDSLTLQDGTREIMVPIFVSMERGCRAHACPVRMLNGRAVVVWTEPQPCQF